MALLAYDALSDYIEIFDNPYLSKFRDLRMRLSQHSDKSFQKKIKLNDHAQEWRSEIVLSYIRNYKRDLDHAVEQV